MKIVNLLDFYKSFSSEEIKEFERFLKSPFLNNIKSLINIFKEIIINRDLIVLNEQEKLLDKLCKKFKLTKGALSKQFSYLSNATLDYFRIKALYCDNNISEIMLDDYLFRKKAYSVLKKRIDSGSKIPKDEIIIDDNIFLNSYKTNIIYYNLLLETSELTNRRSSEFKFKTLFNATCDITLYDLIQLIGMYINYFFVDVNYGFKKTNLFPINLREKFEEYDRNKLFNGDKKKKITFDIYYSLFNMIDNRDNRKYYSKYKEIINKNINMLSKKLIKFHYNVLVSYCIGKERLGEDKEFFEKESVILLYEYFNKNYFNVNEEYISLLDYTNFVHCAYSIGDYKILKSFIENNSTKLKPSEYSDLVNYGLTYYYFGIKDYKKVLKHLNEISLNKLLYKFDIRNMEIKVYYELNKFESLREAIHNYRSIIFDDEVLTDSDKKSLLKMLSYVNKILILNDELDYAVRKKEAEYILLSIDKEPIFSMKKWLTEKFFLILQADTVDKKAFSA